MKVCRIEDCKRKITTASWSGLCAQHMKNLRVWGDTDGDPKAAAEKRRPKDCEIEGCERPFYSQGLCAAHHSRLRRKGDVQANVPIGLSVGVVPPRICAQQGCDAVLNPSAHRARKYCDPHSTAQAIAKRSNVAQKARIRRERANNSPSAEAAVGSRPILDTGEGMVRREILRQPSVTEAMKQTSPTIDPNRRVITMQIYGPDTTPHEHVYRCQDCGEIAPMTSSEELERLADELNRRFLQRGRFGVVEVG